MKTRLLCAFVCLASLARATTYYVSTSGSNAANGTSTSTPWQTIAFVNTHAFSPGDTICFKRGDVWTGTTFSTSSAGSSSNQIIYSGACASFGTATPPILDGRNALNYVASITKNYITLRSLQLQNSTSSSVNFTGTTGTQLLDLVVKNGGPNGHGIYGGFLTGTFLIDHMLYDDDSSHTAVRDVIEAWQDCSTTATVTNSTLDRSHGLGAPSQPAIAVNGGCNGLYQYNTIHGGGQGIGVKPYHNSAGTNCPSGFNPPTDGNRILDNEIDLVSRYGSTTIDGELIEIEGCSTSVPSSNTTVGRNILHCLSDARAYYGSSDAIGAFFATNADIFGNVIYGACQNGVPETSSPGAIRLMRNSTGMRVYNNTAYGTHPDGRAYGAIEFFPGSSGLVKNNVIDNFNIGILMGDSTTSATEDYNLFGTNVPNPYLGATGGLTHGGHSQTSTAPGFVSGTPTTINDLKLASGAAALTSGVSLGSPYNVILGSSAISVPYGTYTQAGSSPWIGGAFGGAPCTTCPVITNFTATPTDSDGTAVVTLAWVTSGSGVTLSIDQGVGTVTGASSSTTVTPIVTTTYKLTAHNSSGDTTATATVTIAGTTGGGTGGGPHRYWRVNTTVTNETGGSPGNAVSALEIEFHTTAGGADVTTGGTAISPDGDPSFPAANAFDNSTGTLWASLGIFGPPRLAYIGYQFATVQSIVEFSWHVRSDGSYSFQSPTAMTLDSSDDGLTWNTACSFSVPMTGTGSWSAGATKTFTCGLGTGTGGGPGGGTVGGASTIGGEIRFFQIRSGDRLGDGTRFQMFCDGEAPGVGDGAVFGPGGCIKSGIASSGGGGAGGSLPAPGADGTVLTADAAQPGGSAFEAIPTPTTFYQFPDKKYIPAANCNGVNPASGWSLPSSSAPTLACHSGSNVQDGFLQFADAQTAQSSYLLPDDWDSTGPVDATLFFSSSSTSGNVIFQIATSCTAPNGTQADDQAFNTAQNFPSITLTTPASGGWTTALTAVDMTGCVPRSLLHVKIGRATDTAVSTANVSGLQLTVRRTF